MKDHITAQQIEQALGLTRVSLTVTDAGEITFTANEPVTDAMRRLVQAWHDAGGVNAAHDVSKLTLRRRIRALGKEALFDAALDAMPNARADWDDAQSLRTDDPLFTTYAPQFKQALDLTDAQFAALLAP
jgi:hypothetical protein